MDYISFIYLMVSEKKISNHVFENLPFRRPGNQPYSAIFIKFIRNVEDYSINISVKKSKTLFETENIVNFHFSHYNSKEDISNCCNSNLSFYST